MIDGFTRGRGTAETVLGTEQRFDTDAGRLQPLDVMHSFSIDPGVIADQADSAPGHQVDAVGQEHVDSWPDGVPDNLKLIIGRVAATGRPDDQP
jgi:hypothetical protein